MGSAELNLKTAWSLIQELESDIEGLQKAYAAARARRAASNDGQLSQLLGGVQDAYGSWRTKGCTPPEGATGNRTR
jgi:hypothetical protein